MKITLLVTLVTYLFVHGSLWVEAYVQEHIGTRKVPIVLQNKSIKNKNIDKVNIASLRFHPLLF